MRFVYFIIFTICLMSSFLFVASKPKLIDTDIRDFGDLCRQYVLRQEQRDFPKRNFDIHLEVKQKELW